MGHKQRHASILHGKEYDDYINSFITKQDVRYLRNPEICRQLISLKYRLSMDVYTPTEFEQLRHILNSKTRPSVVFSKNIDSLDPVLLELAAREKANFQKILSTIVFLSHRTEDGSEISAFIDLHASFAEANLQVHGHTDWQAVFQERDKFIPKPTDLSYYNVKMNIVRHNNSDNYLVRHDLKYGLNFVHRGDHKKIFVDNTLSGIEQNYLRSVVFSPKYGCVIFFDHIIRKKI